MNNKEKILLAGEKLFNQHGYNNTSMRMLCEEAGVSMGGVYSHFKNKEELFSALLEQHHPFQHIKEIVEKHKAKDPEEFFYDMGSDWIKLFNKTALKLMFIDIIEQNGCTFKNCITNLANKDNTKLELVTYIEEKQKEGKIMDSDAHHLAKTFFQMATNYAIHAYLIFQIPDENKDQIAEDFKKFIKIYLFGALIR